MDWQFLCCPDQSSQNGSAGERDPHVCEWQSMKQARQGAPGFEWDVTLVQAGERQIVADPVWTGDGERCCYYDQCAAEDPGGVPTQAFNPSDEEDWSENVRFQREAKRHHQS